MGRRVPAVPSRSGASASSSPPTVHFISPQGAPHRKLTKQLCGGIGGGREGSPLARVEEVGLVVRVRVRGDLQRPHISGALSNPEGTLLPAESRLLQFWNSCPLRFERQRIVEGSRCRQSACRQSVRQTSQDTPRKAGGSETEKGYQPNGPYRLHRQHTPTGAPATLALTRTLHRVLIFRAPHARFFPKQWLLCHMGGFEFEPNSRQGRAKRAWFAPA